MDLTKIEKPFGLLDKATQQALKDHGGPIECYNLGHWRETARPYWVEETYLPCPTPTRENQG
jgi:hypothetical protein